jgi:hypothetical protein
MDALKKGDCSERNMNVLKKLSLSFSEIQVYGAALLHLKICGSNLYRSKYIVLHQLQM